MSEFYIPDNTDNLLQINEQLNKIEKIILNQTNYKKYNLDELQDLSEKITYYLDKLGEMSQVLFDQRDILKKDFYMKYKKEPELGKKLFLQENAKIHAPYDKLKEKCFKLTEKIGKIVHFISEGFDESEY